MPRRNVYTLRISPTWIMCFAEGKKEVEEDVREVTWDSGLQTLASHTVCGLETR